MLAGESPVGKCYKWPQQMSCTLVDIFTLLQLKGLNPKEAVDECEKMKSALKLQDKGSSQSHTLSGGMKRKLSVGIAFSAGSKVSLAKMNTMTYM